MENADRLGASPSGEHLVDAARAGDRAAFAVLVDRDRNLVYAYAYARLGSREEAEDVAQDTFVRAYLSLARLRTAGTWRAWLLIIARNLCSDALRRRRVRLAEPLDPLWPDSTPSPEVQFLAGERRRELRAAVEALPEEYRVPVVMRFGCGCTRREIALALGVPESTITGRMARTMRSLRRELGEEGER